MDNHQDVAKHPHGHYVASRASVPARAAMWRRYRAAGVPIISTWIDEAGEGETADFSELWERITGEIAGAWGLILYAQRDDFPLKGALVEVGIAIALNKPIAIVLDFEPDGRTMRPIGSWIAHKQVSRYQTVETLLNAPIIDDFLEGVRFEAAHQQQRWGVDHDGGKSPEEWLWLVAYLCTKATQAARYGDAEKHRHHVITAGAALLNWHRHATGETTTMRPGVDPEKAEAQVHG
jgi:hypothetical protein